MASVGVRKWKYMDRERRCWVVRFNNPDGSQSIRHFRHEQQAILFKEEIEIILDAVKCEARLADIYEKLSAAQDRRLKWQALASENGSAAEKSKRPGSSDILTEGATGGWLLPVQKRKPRR